MKGIRMAEEEAVGLVYLALQRQDEDCLKVMARVFQSRPPPSAFSYWDLNFADHEADEARIAKTRDDNCTVM